MKEIAEITIFNSLNNHSQMVNNGWGADLAGKVRGFGGEVKDFAKGLFGSGNKATSPESSNQSMQQGGGKNLRWQLNDVRNKIEGVQQYVTMLEERQGRNFAPGVMDETNRQLPLYKQALTKLQQQYKELQDAMAANDFNMRTGFNMSDFNGRNQPNNTQPTKANSNILSGIGGRVINCGFEESQPEVIRNAFDDDSIYRELEENGCVEVKDSDHLKAILDFGHNNPEKINRLSGRPIKLPKESTELPAPPSEINIGEDGKATSVYGKLNGVRDQMRGLNQAGVKGKKKL